MHEMDKLVGRVSELNEGSCRYVDRKERHELETSEFRKFHVSPVLLWPKMEFD
jgi:hypothetical protein